MTRTSEVDILGLFAPLRFLLPAWSSRSRSKSLDFQVCKMSNAAFVRYVGIDYSGAEVPTASLKGLRVYRADGNGSPIEVLPPHSPRKYWTRRGLAEWLVQLLGEDAPTLVGIDHGFSFPLRYFEVHRLKPDWPTFLDDFQEHWPTDDDNT